MMLRNWLPTVLALLFLGSSVGDRIWAPPRRLNYQIDEKIMRRLCQEPDVPK